uniref:Uncharacterized protein n=1 Tax=Globisporangium ultimum (strain ATCC 200006 / CBS 805.95 / DAOM BR144) TaxID=431595 RepID=K3WVH0_GLOUD
MATHWTARLASWVNALDGRVAVEDKQKLDGDDNPSLLRALRWIRVVLPSAPSASADADIRHLRETLALLGLLAHVDGDAFRTVLTQSWRLMPCGEYDEDSVGARFAFLFDDESIAEDVHWPEEVCAKLFAPISSAYATQDNDNGGAFYGMQHELLSVMARNHQEPQSTSATVVIPICLHFKPVGTGYEYLLQFLQSVISIVRGFQDEALRRHEGQHLDAAATVLDEHQQQARAACVVEFELDAMTLHLYSYEITTQAAELLETLVTLGVKIATLAISVRQSDILDGWCTRKAQGALFQAMVLGSDREGASLPVLPPTTDSSPAHGVECITIQGQNVDVDQFAALASVLVQSRHVRELNLFSVFDDRSRANRIEKWQWLAYALFSSQSDHCIRKLGINGHAMQLEDVEAMARVIESTQPALAELVATRTKDASFQALVDDDEAQNQWVPFLIPGFGVCWLERDNIGTTSNTINTRENCRVVTNVPSTHSITELAISFDVDENGNFVALRRLLSLMGRPLKALQIFQGYGLNFDGFLDIVEFCPNLTSLYIEGLKLEPVGLEALADFYDTQLCRISSLHMEDYQISTDTLTQLAKVLSDPSRLMSRLLKELCIGESTAGTVSNYENLDALLEMLRANKTLLYLELHLEAAYFDGYHHEFMKYHDQYLPVIKTPFPLRSQLAFLSLSKSPRLELLRRVDERVLSLVFEFAACGSARKVVVRRK